MELQKERVLILTVRMDVASQEYFDALRLEHFPAERNFLKAHLTLFHKLPDTTETVQLIAGLTVFPFEMQVTGLFNLGAGVAFRVDGRELSALRAALSGEFSESLSAQDRHGFRGHVTVQNKTSPEIASALLDKLSTDFSPFEVQALGLDLWSYLGGPWAHKQFFPFITLMYKMESDALQSAIARKILSVATQRGAGKSTCPSEIARMMFPGDWRKHMKDIRDIAIGLHRSNQVVITQKGMPVDVDHIKGPVRIKIV